MNKTKVDFIADLLSSKALKVEHREKLFLLVSKELSKIEDPDERIILKLKELEADIKQLKSEQATIDDNEEEYIIVKEVEPEGYTVPELLGEKLKAVKSDEAIQKRKAFWAKFANKKTQETEPNVQNEQINRDPKLLIKNKTSPPDPQGTKNFLTYFRDSEGLKYLTHDFKDPASPIDRITLINQAKKEFEEALNKYPSTPTYIRRRIEEFAFKENPEWLIRKGSEKIIINEGWCSNNFIEWFDNQKSPFIKHPCRNSKWNKLIIEPFKRSIQVRDEILLEVIEDNIRLINDNQEDRQIQFNYDEQSLKIADFYTDVDSLGLALYKIFVEIKKHAVKQNNLNVTLEYLPEFENRFKCIRICHLNSRPTKSFDKDFLGGDMTEVRTSLFSLCNWAIEGSFKDGSYRKYILYDKSISTKDTPFKLESEVKGFTHLLMFY